MPRVAATARGLNAVMRAVVRKGERHYGDELVGFLDGWKGVIENRTTDLSVETFRGTLPKGGTMLGSSRTNPFKVDGGVEKCRATLDELGVDALVAIGGEDTLGVASQALRPRRARRRRAEDDRQRPVGHRDDVRFRHRGADRHRCHRSAAHDGRVARPRHGGRGDGSPRRPHREWAGIAGGATMVLIPEEPFDIDAVCDALQRRHARAGASRRSWSSPRVP